MNYHQHLQVAPLPQIPLDQQRRGYDARSFMNMYNLRAYPIYQWTYVTVNQDTVLPAPSTTTDNSLDNDILDYFAYENWRNFTYPEEMSLAPTVESCDYYDPTCNYPRSFYDAITPALRLVSLMIQKVRPLFVRYVRCPVENFNGRPRFDPLWVPTEDDYKFLDWCFEHLARDGVILRREPVNDTNDTVMGYTSIQFDKCYDHDKTKNPLTVLMGITGDLLDEILDENLWNAKTEIAKRSVLLELALILLHETSHALFWRRTFWGMDKLRMRGRTHPPCGFDQLWFHEEPAVPFETEEELGYVTNRFLFLTRIGLAIGNFLSAEDRRQGLVHNGRRPYYDGSRGHAVVNPNGGALLELPPKTVMSFFDKTTWQGDYLHLVLILRNGGAPSGIAQNH